MFDLAGVAVKSVPGVRGLEEGVARERQQYTEPAIQGASRGRERGGMRGLVMARQFLYLNI